MGRVSAAIVLGLLGGCGGGGQRGVDAAPADAAPFACAGGTCDEHSQYCYLIQAGVQAGVAPDVGCNPLPSGCGAAPSCDCVLAGLTAGDCAGITTCREDGDRVTVACMLP